jgi:hypothetical protein
LDLKNVPFWLLVMEQEQKLIGYKERSFLATGGWNENKDTLDLKNVPFWLLWMERKQRRIGSKERSFFGYW